MTARAILVGLMLVGFAWLCGLEPNGIALAQDVRAEAEAAKDAAPQKKLFDDADADAFWDDFMGDVERDKADREKCANTRDTVSKEEQHKACTRLIDDAPNENDLVGSYYVNRALAPKSPEGQCADVSKGIAIIESQNSRAFGGAFLSAAKRLKEAVCR